MPESTSTAIGVRPDAPRTSVVGVFQSVSGSAGRAVVHSGVRAGAWASDVAQKFGGLVSDLLSPAVFTVYAFAAWSLATNLGWTDTFLFTSGPLANWLIWMGLAILLNVASSILKKHLQPETFGR